MQKIKDMYEKYKEVVNYLIFGVLTTVVNFIVFFIFQKLGIDVLINNVLSWIVTKELMKEAISFYGCRVFSLLVEEAMLFILVKKLGINEYIIKVIAQVVIIIMNYVLSKVITFRKKD